MVDVGTSICSAAEYRGIFLNRAYFAVEYSDFMDITRVPNVSVYYTYIA
jgi:hypothetical protein